MHVTQCNILPVHYNVIECITCLIYCNINFKKDNSERELYHPTILLITAVRAVQLAVTSYMGWNKGLEVKLYKHKHEIYILTSYIGWNKGLVVKLCKHKHEILRLFLLYASLFITRLFSMGMQ